MTRRRGTSAIDWAQCPCGQKFQRPAGETYACLSCQTAERLTAAGIRSDDPALVAIREYNAEARRKAAPSQAGAA